MTTTTCLTSIFVPPTVRYGLERDVYHLFVLPRPGPPYARWVHQHHPPRVLDAHRALHDSNPNPANTALGCSRYPPVVFSTAAIMQSGLSPQSHVDRSIWANAFFSTLYERQHWSPPSIGARTNASALVKVHVHLLHELLVCQHPRPTHDLLCQACRHTPPNRRRARWLK